MNKGTTTTGTDSRRVREPRPKYTLFEVVMGMALVYVVGHVIGLASVTLCVVIEKSYRFWVEFVGGDRVHAVAAIIGIFCAILAGHGMYVQKEGNE